MSEAGHYGSPVATGLACKCPRCGKGKLFDGLLKVAERCNSCGLDLSKQDPGDGPAVFVILILGAITVGLAVTLEFKLEPPLWLHLILWPPFVLFGAIFLLQRMKGLLVSLQYATKASEGGTVDYD